MRIVSRVRVRGKDEASRCASPRVLPPIPTRARVRPTRLRDIDEAEAPDELVLDIAFLTGVLYLSGGAANPLVRYYLIPLIVSAALLESRYTWVLTALAVASCSTSASSRRPRAYPGFWRPWTRRPG